MTVHDAELIADAVVRKQMRMAAPVLNRDDAMLLAGRGSSTAFNRWCQAYGVPPQKDGRYARIVIERALNKEAKAKLRKSA